MADEDHYALGEIDRRLANLVRYGTIAAVDVANALVTVDLGGLVTDWLPWAAGRAGQNRTWAPPDIGEQVALLSPGDPSQGIVIGSLWQAAHPANGNAQKDTRITFKDGTVIEQDRDTGALNVQASAGGSIRLNVGGATLLLQAGQATLTAPLLVVDAAQSTFTGAVTIGGLLTWAAGMSGSGGSGAAITGNMAISSGDVTADGIGLKTHTHSDPQGGTVGGPM